jgi:poly-gamma-glutamate synthesis protein (capsule biosynthesis protein)
MIFYSLGNFIFDEEGVKNEKWNYGFILSLKIERGAIDFEVIPYNQCSKKPVVYKLEGKERRQFKSKMAEINEIIQNPKNLQTRYKAYCEHRMKSLSTLFEPYENRYLKGLNARRIIPTLISKEKYIRLYNYLLCQAHRDLVDYKLESEIQN